MSVVTGALGSLAPKLAQLLHGEYKLQKGVRKQVQWLQTELESIYAFLTEVGDVPWDRLNGQVKVWARAVREASYDMEDVLDTYLVHVDGGEPTDPSRLIRAMKKIGKVFSKAKARRGIAGAIADIKETLEEVNKRRQNYKIDDNLYKPLATSSTIDPRTKALYRKVTQLIGVNKSRDKLISMLNPSQPDLLVSDNMMKVSIVGAGGLGKTTLARVVYDKLKTQHDCGAFVSVGRDYNLENIFKDILFDLDDKKYEKIHDTRRGLQFLIREVREFLENKRYFVVIDDVWDVRTWETMEQSLVENNCGSKVITTTRKVDVAKAAGSVFDLKPLSSDDSMELFYTRIFGEDRKYLDKQPNDVSNKILKRCDGIPLAIITMASLFAGKPECEWSEVYNSIGFDTKDNMESEDTMTILSFSYYDLPPHLRTCLLYLCTYPEDCLIQKEPLIWKWIAEGFIDQKQGTRLFDLGEKYFNDLINRSLIQVGESPVGMISSCHVHDMVLDLIRKLSSEETFVAILDDNIQGTPAASNVRRLSRHNRISEHINSETVVTGMPKVRSYTAIRCYIDNRDQLFRWKLLRVLDLTECRFKEGCHLEHLGDLLHLRYLRIYLRFRLEISEPMLPKQIGNLKLLQTLEVDGVGELPTSIVQLTQLIRLQAEYALPPNGIGNLTSLEELSIRVYPNDESERFMKELNSLQELRVLRTFISADESTQRHFVESLLHLKKIQHLEVNGYTYQADTAVWEAAGFVLPRALSYLYLPFHFSKLPQCINPSRLPNLSHLRLYVKTLDESDMENIARLPALCFLQLIMLDFSHSYYFKINVRDGYFQKLRYFHTDQLVQLEQPNVEAASVSLHTWNRIDAVPFGSRKRYGGDSRTSIPSGSMTNLEVLEFCVPLRALKDSNGDCGNIGLEYLPSLRKLGVDIFCDGVCAEDVEDALAVLRNACEVHPNHPTLDSSRSLNKGMMVSTNDKEDEKQWEEEVVVASQTADIDLGKLSPGSS